MRALVVAAIAAPLALILAGASGPLVSIAGAVGLVALAIAARARIRERAPSALEVALGALGAAAFAFAIALGGALYAWVEQDSPIAREVSVSLAILAASAFAMLAAARSPLADRIDGPEREPAPAPRVRAIAVVLALAALFHLMLLVTLPPLTQLDSYVNLYEPSLFARSERFLHHPPVYVLLVKLFGVALAPRAGLTALMAIQHALALGAALAVERAVRLETRSSLAAAIGCALVALDGFFALYAQSVMSETVAIALAVAAAALLVEARHRRDARPWLVAAGVAAALGTLTRQASEGWFVVGLAWVLVSDLRPRFRAAALFLAGATLPVLALVLHNYCFHHRPALTANDGRCLSYRVVLDMPELTDPAAPPGDELERARRLVWQNRDNCWMGPYGAIQRELGWDDARIDAAMHRFYFEQAFKHPWEFTKVTCRLFFILMIDQEQKVAGLIGLHDVLVEHAEENGGGQWRELGRAEHAPPLSEPLMAAANAAYPILLALSIAACAIARGPSRRLALLGLGSAFYFVGIAALTQPALVRYRLPGAPFLAIGGCVAIAAAARRLGRE